jgi:hypothetical protein
MTISAQNVLRKNDHLHPAFSKKEVQRIMSRVDSYYRPAVWLVVQDDQPGQPVGMNDVFVTEEFEVASW